jgi:hypothetical protein
VTGQLVIEEGGCVFHRTSLSSSWLFSALREQIRKGGEITYKLYLKHTVRSSGWEGF